MFMLFISSETSSSQRVLGLPIDLLDMGFHLSKRWENAYSAYKVDPVKQFIIRGTVHIVLKSGSNIGSGTGYSEVLVHSVRLSTPNNSILSTHRLRDNYFAACVHQY